MNVLHAAAHHRSASMASKKLIYPAADRNKEPILQVLKKFIHPGANQTLLELASGSGQHVAHFAPHFPQVTFQPSDADASLLESIAAHTAGLGNVREPLHIDASTDYKTWASGIFKEKSFDYIYCCNMIHVSPYKCTIGLFRNAGALLKPQGMLFTYGAYCIDGKITPESNVEFDKSIRAQNPEWGLRELREIEKLAQENGIKLIQVFDMPANNKTVVWSKI